MMQLHHCFMAIAIDVDIDIDIDIDVWGHVDIDIDTDIETDIELDVNELAFIDAIKEDTDKILFVYNIVFM